MSAAFDLASVAPGFADPARDAQTAFRAVMQAMARPGRVADLSFAPEPPEGLSRAAAALALTLLDFETPAWVAAPLATPAVTAWLRFHCGCPLVSDPYEALFALAPAAAPPGLHELNPGDPRYPDRSTTLVLVGESLLGGPRVRLTGPGLKDPLEIAPAGIPAGLWAERAQMRKRFPLGIDVAITAGDRLIALPRTTAGELLEG